MWRHVHLGHVPFWSASRSCSQHRPGVGLTPPLPWCHPHPSCLDGSPHRCPAAGLPLGPHCRPSTAPTKNQGAREAWKPLWLASRPWGPPPAPHGQPCAQVLWLYLQRGHLGRELRPPNPVSGLKGSQPPAAPAPGCTQLSGFHGLGSRWAPDRTVPQAKDTLLPSSFSGSETGETVSE